MKPVPDYSAYINPNPPTDPPRTVYSGFEIVFFSIVLGIYFALLMFGMMIFGSRMMNESKEAACGMMCFDQNLLAFLIGCGFALEGAVGGFFASLFLLSILEKKPLGRVIGLTLFIHSILLSALGFLLGATEQAGICGMGAFVGGSFAITSALIATRTQDIPAQPPESPVP